MEGKAPPTKQPRLTRNLKGRRTKNVKEAQLSVEEIAEEMTLDNTGLDFDGTGL